jgi:adenosylcobinamide-GDP ribazoletransferase
VIRAALGSLTRLPVAGGAGGSGVAGFGIAGSVVGLAGFAVLALIGERATPLAAILAIAAMTIVSGGLHLDGLADTADALLAPDPDSAERARKDPAIGVAGALALAIVLSLEVGSIALLAGVSGGFVAGLACVVAAACSRALAVDVAFAAQGRASNGWGGRFAREVTPVRWAVATGSAVAVVAVAGLLGDFRLVPGAMAGVLIGGALGWWIVRARRQLDGDALGAAVELTFCAVLVATTLIVASVDL